MSHVTFYVITLQLTYSWHAFSSFKSGTLDFMKALTNMSVQVSDKTYVKQALPDIA